MASIFKRLSWGSEPITTNKLQEMVNNDDWLRDNAIFGYYNVLGIARESGLSIRTGYVKSINTNNQSLYLSVYFNRPFLPGTRPVVVTSFATGHYHNITFGIKGLDGRGIPDHRGFVAIGSQGVLREKGQASKFSGNDQYFSYIAIGPNG